jgi:hypothetical protein
VPADTLAVPLLEALAEIEAEQKRMGPIRDAVSQCATAARRERIVALRKAFRAITKRVDDIDRRRIDVWLEAQKRAARPKPKPRRKPHHDRRDNRGRYEPAWRRDVIARESR